MLNNINVSNFLLNPSINLTHGMMNIFLREPNCGVRLWSCKRMWIIRFFCIIRFIMKLLFSHYLEQTYDRIQYISRNICGFSKFHRKNHSFTSSKIRVNSSPIFKNSMGILEFKFVSYTHWLLSWCIHVDLFHYRYVWKLDLVSWRLRMPFQNPSCFYHIHD